MTTPEDNVSLSWQFQMDLGTTPTEIAELGVWGSAGVTPPGTSALWDSYLDEAAQLAADAWQSTMSGGNYTAEISLAGVHAVHYDTTGHTANEAYEPPTSAWAGEGGAALPWQIAQVVSLYSYTPGGFVTFARRRRGRVYLPGLSTDMMAASGPTAGEGLFDETKATDNRDHLHLILKAIVDGMGVLAKTFTPCVYSRVAGALYPITDMVTTVKPETQRRRENKLVVDRLAISY